MADLLDELERLEKSATPGPWKWDSDQIKGDPMNRCRYRVCVVGKTVMQTYYSSDDVHAEADATLTCALRNALPELLRRLRAAETDLNAWKAGGSTGTIHQWREDAARWQHQLRVDYERHSACSATSFEQFAATRNAAIDAARRKP